MIITEVTETQMQAARVASGAAMVGFLAASMFGRQAQKGRVAVVSLYIAGVLGLAMYFLS